ARRDPPPLFPVTRPHGESTDESGACRSPPDPTRPELVGGPKDRFTLTLTKEAAAQLDANATVHNDMAPGMLSMHHFSTVHSSGPNRSDRRRVAFVGRYMSPAISQETAESGQAVLVRGHDTHKHFALKERFPMTWTG
ncbi:MAG: phytanoyl-CoA dioxygenase family protein, partial [Myxococcales bacterium]|nr:phytanoyl-CoA dioxygenase family protein [Myxococcales bacterium]